MYGRFLTGYTWVAAACCLHGIAAFAGAAPVLGRRATEQEMDLACKPLEEYLRHLPGHFVAIDSLLLKRGKVETEQFVARITKARDTADDPVDRSICGYLLARARYWQAFHGFKTTRDRTIFDTLRPELVDEYLRTFKDLCEAERQHTVATPVYTPIILGFASALATNIWGARLSAERKGRVVREFIDVVEQTPAYLKVFDRSGKSAKMYRHLGIQSRLGPLVPSELPTDFEKLVLLLRKAGRADRPEQLLPVAAAIERDHRALLDEQPDALALVAGVYKSCGQRKKAHELLMVAAARDVRYYLSLYMLSFENQSALPHPQPEQYLTTYIRAGAPAKRPASEGRYTREQAYLNAARSLLRAKRYHECVLTVQRYGQDESFEHTTDGQIAMLSRKAKALEKSGDRPGALAAYRALVQKIGDTPDHSLLRDIARRRIEILTDVNLGD